jgi:hypothetical protein
MPMNPDTHSMIGVVVPNEIKEQVKKLAESEKRSMSAQIAYLLEQYLKEHGYLGERADD